MRFLAVIGVLAILVGIAAAIFFLGGFYSVAATNQDPGVVDWALVHVRTASIARHATEAPPSTLDDPKTVQAGAKAFSTLGCVNCHGTPGVDGSWAKFSEGIQPTPADLTEIAKERTPAEIFWVVKNGIKMTGMPSFGSKDVPDAEIWTIAAFVSKWTSVKPEEYKAWTAAP
jgi:mono/diheme cytochrome c family protein